MTVEPSEHTALCNPKTNAVVALAIETASEGYGALVFCGGRQACQATALLISQAMPGCSDETFAKRQGVVLDLKSLPMGLDETLEETVPRGVAFHRKELLYPNRLDPSNRSKTQV